MNNVASLLLSGVIGLVAGVGHGIVSERLDLPFSLTDQVLGLSSTFDLSSK